MTRDTDLSERPYAYCDGDPVNFSDPSGHLKVPDWLKKLLKNLTQNLSAVSGTVTKAVTGGFAALGSGFGLAKLGGAWETMQINNQGLANEKQMLNNYYNSHPDADMTHQWELYQYMQKGTLQSDAGFAAQAGDQYLHGVAGAR